MARSGSQRTDPTEWSGRTLIDRNGETDRRGRLPVRRPRHRPPGVGRRAEPAPARHAPGAGAAAPRLGLAGGEVRRAQRDQGPGAQRALRGARPRPLRGGRGAAARALPPAAASGGRLRPSPHRAAATPPAAGCPTRRPGETVSMDGVDRGTTWSVGGGPTTRRRAVWRARRALRPRRRRQSSRRRPHGHGVRGAGHGHRSDAGRQRDGAGEDANGIFSELKDTAKDAALDVLKPVSQGGRTVGRGLRGQEGPRDGQGQGRRPDRRRRPPGPRPPGSREQRAQGGRARSARSPGSSAWAGTSSATCCPAATTTRTARAARPTPTRPAAAGACPSSSRWTSRCP